MKRWIRACLLGLALEEHYRVMIGEYPASLRR